jgi:hypothetical protein
VALVFLADSDPVAGATSATPAAVVATLQEGDHAFIPVSFKRPGSATLATPADWAEIASATVGTGAAGEGAGPIGVRVYYRKVPSGGLTLPTLTLGGVTTGSVVQAGLIVYRGDLGAASELAYAVTSGSDTSEGTDWSVTGAANIGLTAGDALLCLGAITGPTATNITAGTVALIVPGTTPDPLTVSNPYSTSSGTGDNVRSVAYRTTIGGGAESAPPQMTATLGNSGTGGTGGTVFLRLREGTRSAPGAVFDLLNVKWQGPVEDPGDPGDLIEVEQPALNTYFSDYLYLDDATGRMVMRAPVQGFETSGAARSEFREMQGGTEAAWTPYDTDGVRQLTVTERVDPTSLTDRQEIIVGQIHGALSTPIPLILSAEWESGGSPVTPRIRVFFNGSGVGNLLSGQLTPTTDYTYRIRYDPPDPGGPDPERGGTVSVFAAVGGEENLPASPQFSWRGDEFTDDSGWYLKGPGAYNKSEKIDGGTGVAVVEISHFELIQPGDQETRRFYLPNLPSTTPPVSVASWVNDGTAANNQHLLTEQPAGAPTSFSRAETTSTTPWYVLLGRWVSGPVSAGGTVYGDWSAAVAMLQSPADAQLEPFLVVFGTVGETDERRGTAISVFLDSIDNLPTSGASALQGGPGTGLDMELQVGDRLIVDWGYVAQNTVTTSRTGTLHYGGTTTPDLAAGATDYTRPAWVELTVTPELSFDQPDVVTGALAATAPTPTAALAAATRTTGALTATLPQPTAALAGTSATSGGLNAQLPLPTASVAAAVRAAGSLHAQLPAPSAAIVGDTAVPGALAATLPSATAQLAGTVSAAGHVAGVAPVPGAHLTGDVAATGVLTGTMPLPTAQLAAGTHTGGQLGATAPLPGAALTGTAAATGELTATLPIALAHLGGDGAASGDLHTTIPTPAAAFAGGITASAELGATLPLSTADLTGTVTAGDATLAAVLPFPTATFIAASVSTATLDATLPVPGAALAGTVTAAGSMTAELPTPTATITSAEVTTGAITAVLPAPAADLDASTSTAGHLAALLPVPAAALTGTVTGAGELAAVLPLPAAALAADVDDPESHFAAVLPFPAAQLDATTATFGVLAAVLPMATADLVTTPPPTYEGPLRAGQPEWGSSRLRAGLPERAS